MTTSTRRYHLWRDELWTKYRNDSIISTYFRADFAKETLAFITDRFRLLLLRDYGGVFCDVDAKLVGFNTEYDFTFF